MVRNAYRAKLHFGRVNKIRIIANEGVKVPVIKPTTSHSKERGRSTTMEERYRGYEQTPSSANNSFALNSSFQQNAHNYSFDYYQSGRMSMNNPNITMYNAEGKGRRSKHEYSPMNFYNTNFNGFSHKRGNTKA